MRPVGPRSTDWCSHFLPMDLATLFDLYRRYRTPRKSDRERRADVRRIDLWTRVLGPDRHPAEISLRDWEAFHDARLTGAIDARGREVLADAPCRRCARDGNGRGGLADRCCEACDGRGRVDPRVPVRPRTVEADLKWLRWVLNWATRWRTEDGYLLSEDPVRGFEIPVEKNPRRPVATRERYEATRAVSDRVLMCVRGEDGAGEVRSHLSELLDLANGTGRRLSAICALRYEDLRLDRGPHGAIRWPADTDKQGRASLVPISPAVRAALDRVLSARPVTGRAFLFPSPGDPAKPVSRHLADKWLRRAERLAGLEPLEGSLWHAYRRKWATERKHLPPTDVAAAGGWAGPESMQRSYQHADQATMLRVVLGGRDLEDG